jgi:hypothetical protein
METVKAQIDINTPTGRHLLREVAEHPKTAKKEYPLPKSLEGKKLYTVKDVFYEVEKDLNAHYDSDCKLKL